MHLGYQYRRGLDHIDGVFYVIDPGFAKINVFNAKLGMDSLVVTQSARRLRDNGLAEQAEQVLYVLPPLHGDGVQQRNA